MKLVLSNAVSLITRAIEAVKSLEFDQSLSLFLIKMQNRGAGRSGPETLFEQAAAHHDEGEGEEDDDEAEDDGQAPP